jgi:hypothetical protein
MISNSNADLNNKSLNFFFDKKLNPTIGLSCNSENECKNLCNNNQTCQKEVKTCLSCIGSKSPYLNDFFNNVGELTTACREQSINSLDIEKLFNYVGMVPIFPISPYNPLGLKDLGLMLKFMSLCPAGTLEPIAIAITDNATHAILDIPLVKCGTALYPLVRMGENCSEKYDQITNLIQDKENKINEIKNNYQTNLKLGETLPIKYEIIQYSDYSEAQYISCSDASKSICQMECHSSLSCVFPTNNEQTAKGIAAFNKGTYSTCGIERFSFETLKSYFNSNNSFSFNSLSLDELYDLPQSSNDLKDLTIINTIMNNFAGVFQSGSLATNGSFFISNKYLTLIQNKMNHFCDDGADAFILGHNDKVERIFCRNGPNGYFKIVANADENCDSKMGQLSITNAGEVK